MKNLFVLLISLLFFSSCEKERNDVHSGGLHFSYVLFFELMDAESKAIPDNKIEMSYKNVMNNGNLEVFRWRLDQPPLEQRWFKTGLVLQDSTPVSYPFLSGENKDLFGFGVEDEPFSPLYFESGHRVNLVIEGVEPPVRDWYYLFRNVDDHSKVDTLRIHDVVSISRETSYRSFEYFWNEEPVEYRELDSSLDSFGYLPQLRVKE